MGNYNHLRAGNLQAENDKPNLVLMLWICYLFFFSHFNAPLPRWKTKSPTTLMCKDTVDAACDSCDWIEENTI